MTKRKRYLRLRKIQADYLAKVSMAFLNNLLLDDCKYLMPRLYRRIKIPKYNGLKVKVKRYKGLIND
ncbi:hypothetical protein [Bacillus sp. FJAT-27445]|uniref:hypothetical protein n=1 Tax=Bacillus sp. FJAT-27445 TaxID=1679166 RepID=UPI000A5E9F03|nr:hypothetical protein [Bacillus sp. FJAT-27445]